MEPVVRDMTFIVRLGDQTFIVPSQLMIICSTNLTHAVLKWHENIQTMQAILKAETLSFMAVEHELSNTHHCTNKGFVTSSL